MFILSLYILFKAIKKENLQGSYELLFRPKIKLNARQKKNGNIGSLPHALFRKTCYRGEDLASTSILGEFWCSQLRRTWEQHIRSETSHLQHNVLIEYTLKRILFLFQIILGWLSALFSEKAKVFLLGAVPVELIVDPLLKQGRLETTRWIHPQNGLEISGNVIRFIFVTNIQKLFSNRSSMWSMEISR